jgi:hypothetical protein
LNVRFVPRKSKAEFDISPAPSARASPTPVIAPLSPDDHFAHVFGHE